MLTHYRGWSADGAGRLLLICGGIGFFFYILGGWFGERWGRREVLVWTGIITGPLNLAFMFVHGSLALSIIYFAIYQATNGTWSGPATPTGQNASRPACAARRSAGSERCSPPD